jgi:hypothetical protein
MCLAAVCGALYSFTACAGSSNASNSSVDGSAITSVPSASDSAPEKGTTIYDTLNELAGKEYAEITLTITVTQGENTLTSYYDVRQTETGYTVDYDYMLANSIEEKDGSYVLPAEYATTYFGSAVYENGKQVSHTGAELNANVSTSLNVRFAQSYFSAWTASGGAVEGTVANGSAFGGNAAYNNATFSLKYTESGLQSFTLRYQDGGATVTAEYRFA